jgi:hypothetical protein
MPFRMGSNDKASLLIQTKSSNKPFNMIDPIRMAKKDFAERIRDAGRYAIRASTMHGAEMDFDPDAMLQNLVVGMLGLNTEDGLGESFDNPEGGGRENWKYPERAVRSEESTAQPCDHGRGPTEYCMPCGRIHGGA